ncbi:MAG: helix-turn-helix domain-containing protein [Chloroflexota bacterium]|nr:helix-turn-helix domain-containing protein [Chloroflexota bacterium]
MVESTLHPLRAARLNRGLSQEQLAEQVGVGERTIKRAEAGMRPHPDTIRRLSRYLKQSPKALGLLSATSSGQGALLGQSAPYQRGAPELASHLRRVLAEYASLDNLIGPSSLLAVVPAQLAAVEQLLGDASPDASGELLGVAARCAELAGWVYQDAGDLRAADRWTARAVDYALAGGDARLVSYVLMRRSNVASDAGDAPRALGLAQAALREGDRLTPQLRAVALRQEAHGHALRGDGPACARALDEAMGEVLAGGSPEPEFDLTAYCTPGYVGMEAAACWIQLGQPKRAIATFDDRLATWPAGYKRDLGLCLARLAVAHAADGDLEQAQAVGQQAIAVVQQTHSARTLRELARLDTLLRQWGSMPEATELTRALREVARPVAVPRRRERAHQSGRGGLPWS